MQPPNALEVINRFHEWWNRIYGTTLFASEEERKIRTEFTSLGYTTGYDQGWKDRDALSTPTYMPEDPTELEIQQKISGG